MPEAEGLASSAQLKVTLNLTCFQDCNEFCLGWTLSPSNSSKYFLDQLGYENSILSNERLDLGVSSYNGHDMKVQLKIWDLVTVACQLVMLLLDGSR